jgi:hypothetical protein
LKTGGYYWRVQAVNALGHPGPWSGTGKVVVSVPPGIPTLYKPPNGAVGVEVSPIFSWSAPNGAASYTIQLSYDSAFKTVILYGTTTQTQWAPKQPLGYSFRYYWRVRANNTYGTAGEWSDVHWFKTK